MDVPTVSRDDCAATVLTDVISVPGEDRAVGDHLEFVVLHVCTTVNLHDVLVGIRDDHVEDGWENDGTEVTWLADEQAPLCTFVVGSQHVHERGELARFVQSAVGIILDGGAYHRTEVVENALGARVAQRQHPLCGPQKSGHEPMAGYETGLPLLDAKAFLTELERESVRQREQFNGQPERSPLNNF